MVGGELHNRITLSIESARAQMFNLFGLKPLQQHVVDSRSSLGRAAKRMANYFEKVAAQVTRRGKALLDSSSASRSNQNLKEVTKCSAGWFKIVRYCFMMLRGAPGCRQCRDVHRVSSQTEYLTCQLSSQLACRALQGLWCILLLFWRLALTPRRMARKP